MPEFSILTMTEVESSASPVMGSFAYTLTPYLGTRTPPGVEGHRLGTGSLGIRAS